MWHRALTRRPRVLGLERAYHGCTMGSCGLMNQGIYRDLFDLQFAQQVIE